VAGARPPAALPNQRAGRGGGGGGMGAMAMGRGVPPRMLRIIRHHAQDDDDPARDPLFRRYHMDGILSSPSLVVISSLPFSTRLPHHPSRPLALQVRTHPTSLHTCRRATYSHPTLRLPITASCSTPACIRPSACPAPLTAHRTSALFARLPLAGPFYPNG
jgi:hypothetical protein